MNWIVIALALLAQAPSSETRRPEIVRAKEDLRRLEALVAAGALAPARLIEARQSLADAEDAAVLDRTLYAKILLQDFTEQQASEMVAAAERRLARHQQRIGQQQQLIEAGVLARGESGALTPELDARRNAVQRAQSRARLLQELLEIALSEQAVAAAPSTVAGHGGPLVERFQGSGRFNDGDLKRLTLEFEKKFTKPLPVSAKGETAVHRTLGFDHRGRVDIGVSPDSPEGAWMRGFLADNHIPYIAFRRSISGQATAAHIHIGTPSPKLASAD